MTLRKRSVFLATGGVAAVALALVLGLRLLPKGQELPVEPPPLPELDRAHPHLARQLEQIDAKVRQGELESLGRLARMYHANGYLNEAIQVYDILLQVEPEDPRWPHLLAFILAGYGRLEVSLPLWERVIELDPGYLPAHFRRADALLKLNRFEEARQVYNEVRKQDFDNPYAFVGLARLAINEGELQQARSHLLDAAGNSDNRIGIDLLVTVFEQLGEKGKAAYLRGQQKAKGSYTDMVDPWLQDLMDVCYDPYQLVTAGGFAAFSGDLDRGKAILKRALRYEPDHAMAHFQIAGMYAAAGDHDKALEHFARTASIDPTYADAWLRQAELYRELGEDGKADEMLTRGLANRPDSPALNLAWGEQLQKRGELDGAIRRLRRSIALRPNEAQAYIILAGVYFQKNAFREAEDLLLESLEYEPGNPVVLTTMARLSIHLLDRTEADQWIARVREQPRILPEHVKLLEAAYEEAFGRQP